MQQNLQKSLEFLGLKKEDIKIYLCLLEYGNLAISSISRITKIGRVNCYHHVDKLVKNGYLISSKKKLNKYLFSGKSSNIFK